MRTQVEKWGNSLAVRIPKSVAAEMNIKTGSEVDLSVANGCLIANALSEERYSLEKLLAGVTKRNLHGETDFGPATHT
jgi:antitoxin MazE